MSEASDMKETLGYMLKMLELKEKLYERQKDELEEKRDDIKKEIKKYNMKSCMTLLDEFMEADDPNEVEMPSPATMLHIVFQEIKKIKDKLNM